MSENTGTQKRGHLELSAQYNREAWFPALPGATERLTSILDSPNGINRELLISELKRDLSVVSALTRLLLSKSDEQGIDGTLLSLRHIPDSEIRKLVKPAEICSSRHGMSETRPWQRARILETAIAVTTAEALSPSYDLESELAFTCALMRQLGLSLLAWNYPHVFHRALNIIRPGETLDTTLGKILGFTPTLLTLTILRSAKAPPVILRVIGDRWVQPDSSPQNATLIEKLTSLCQLSEALARWSTRGSSVSDDENWERSRVELEDRLGPAGWKILESELQWSLAAYSRFDTDLFSANASLNKLSDLGTPDTRAAIALEGIPLPNGCPARLQGLLENFYLMRASGSGRKDLLRYLFRVVIPRSGVLRAVLLKRIGSENKFEIVQDSTPNPKGFDDGTVEPPNLNTTIRFNDRSHTEIFSGKNQSGRPWLAAFVGEANDELLYLEHDDGIAGTSSLTRNILPTFLRAIIDARLGN